MKKTLEIQGMSCSHCEGRVADALNSLPGVQAVVNHKKNQAVITITGEVSDETLKEAVREAGYEPGSIGERRGFFGI